MIYSCREVHSPQDGSYELTGGLPQVHQQRGEARQEAGPDPAVLQGGGQVPHRHDEARIHRGVRGRG